MVCFTLSFLLLSDLSTRSLELAETFKRIGSQFAVLVTFFRFSCFLASPYLHAELAEDGLS